MAKQEKVEASRRGVPRGKNFAKSEDRQICFSWTYVTQDAIKGTDQSVSAFWTAVAQNACAAVPALSCRTWDAIRQRFNTISRNVTKFAGCVRSVERMNKSGASATDKLNMALEIFKTDHKEDFKYLDCYEVLKLCPKYDMREASPKTPKTPVATEENTPVPDTPQGRPIGQKSAKAKLKIDETERSKIAALEMMAKATMEKNEIMRHSNRIKIITTSVAGLDDISAEILMLEKKKILRELQSDTSLSDLTNLDKSTPSTSQEINSDSVFEYVSFDEEASSSQAAGPADTAEMAKRATSSSGLTTSGNVRYPAAKRVKLEYSLIENTVTFDPDSLIMTDEEGDYE